MTQKTSLTNKKFYVIRFDDGFYFSGTTPFTRRRVPFRKARLFSQRNHAALCIRELKHTDASIIELTIEEPDYEKEKASEEESNRTLS